MSNTSENWQVGSRMYTGDQLFHRESGFDKISLDSTEEHVSLKKNCEAQEMYELTNFGDYDIGL